MRVGKTAFMPDIILPGSAGRIEARYQRQKNPGAPMALVLHSHPQFGGTMNNPLVYDLFHMFHGLGCTAVRFNFRGAPLEDFVDAFRSRSRESTEERAREDDVSLLVIERA